MAFRGNNIYYLFLIKVGCLVAIAGHYRIHVQRNAETEATAALKLLL